MNEHRPSIDIEHGWELDCDGQLVIGGYGINEIVKKFGSPLFIYDESKLGHQLGLLRTAFPEFEIYYSMKANPHPRVVQFFSNSLDGIEIASAGELQMALQSGCAPERILFAGPGKSDFELNHALEAGISEFHIESLGEAERLNRLAHEKGCIPRVSVRVNPGIQIGAMRMGGRPTQFGIDEEQLDEMIPLIEKLDHLSLEGIHLFAGTQILDAELLIQAYQHCLEMAARVSEIIRRPLKTIDFGGGLGTPYFAHETELDLEVVGEGIDRIVQSTENSGQLKNTRLMIEPGRFLAGPAGVYVAKVIDTKISRGKKFVVLNGGMNHHLAASGNLGQTIKRNYSMALVSGRCGERSMEPVELVGPLCTPLDAIGRKVDMPQLQIGDLVGVFDSGAYGRSASPIGFLSHQPPVELYVDSNGVMQGTRIVQSFSNVTPQS